MLAKEHRISKDYHFRRLKNQGTTVRTKFFLMNYLKNEFGVSRFGFIVTTKTGNAVERNRATRVMREAIRLHLAEIKEGYDFAFVLNRSTIKAKTPVVEEVLLQSLKEHGLLISSNDL